MDKNKTFDLGNGVILTFNGKAADGADLWQLNDVVLDHFANAKMDPVKHKRGG